VVKRVGFLLVTPVLDCHDEAAEFVGEPSPSILKPNERDAPISVTAFVEPNRWF
jgi:hypothetical protein